MPTKTGKEVMRNGMGFTLVELMVVISIIGIITAIAIPYYSNYKKTACDQAALADLFNVKAAVQKKITDDALSSSGAVATDSASVGAAVTAVLADTTGKYGYPGPTLKCQVALSSSGSLVTSQTPLGTEQGIKGWSLDMAGGKDAVAVASSSGTTTGTGTSDTSTNGSGTDTTSTGDSTSTPDTTSTDRDTTTSSDDTNRNSLWSWLRNWFYSLFGRYTD